MPDVTPVRPELRPPTERHEILEERGNRDAFWIALFLCVLLAGLIALLITLAAHSHFMLMSLPEKTPATKAQLLFAPRMKSPAGIWESGNAAARAGVRAPQPAPDFTCGPVPAESQARVSHSFSRGSNTAPQVAHAAGTQQKSFVRAPGADGSPVSPAACCIISVRHGGRQARVAQLSAFNFQLRGWSRAAHV